MRFVLMLLLALVVMVIGLLLAIAWVGIWIDEEEFRKRPMGPGSSADMEE